ncbi:MAG TPA: hypothetical protein VF765_23440 [Polyangiaceae bacterium]
MKTEEILRVWVEKDRARAVLPADREIVDASEAPRALIVELAIAGGPEDELYDACLMWGRMVAQRGGSPTFASSTLGHAAEALGTPSAPWLPAARAAVAEGFVAAMIEDARSEALQSWEYPSCAVPLGEAALAIAAGHPSDDEEVLGAWAARVAKAAAMSGIRRAVVAGGERARAALVDAFGVVGIEVHAPPKPRSR